MRRAAIVMAVLAVVAGFAGGAQADPIGPDCGSCFGNIFTLEIANVVVGATTTTLQAILTIDTSQTDLSATDVIRSVAIKITPKTSDIIQPVTLTEFLIDGADGGTGNWTVLVGGLNNNGCADGSQGFICAEDADVAPLDGSVYTWVFDVTVKNNTVAAEGGVKAQYCVAETDCEGNNFQGLTSERIPIQPRTGLPQTGFVQTGSVFTPGPAGLIVLGLGLMGLGSVSVARSLLGRRRR